MYSYVCRLLFVLTEDCADCLKYGHSIADILLNPGVSRGNLDWYFVISAGNSNSEFQPDRPIGYGAFGVVWSVTDPRDGKRVALKKLPNVFQSLVSSKRVFRELKMMRFFKHENVLCCLDILQVREWK